MNVSLEKSSTDFKFLLELDKDDSVKGIGQGGAEVELLHNAFTFTLPCEVDQIHPDVVALAILTIVLPWVGKRISFPEAVSPEFASSVHEVFNFQVDTIDRDLKRRARGKRSALSFSGGVDSFAAALVLPEDSVKLTFIRKQHEEVEDCHPQYSIDAMLEIVERVDNAYPVYSDLEHIVGPLPQYPTWVALSTPCLLLADHFDVQSISYGTIMGSAYTPAGRHYRSVAVPDQNWRILFAAAGIDLTKPVAGLTEIGTSMIVNNSAYRDIASSCQFGSFNSPCMKCLKCFRKYFIGLAINNERPKKEILENFWKQNGVRNYISSQGPLYFQHIYMYSFTKIKRSDLIYPFRLFYDKLMEGKQNLVWCAKSYPVALTAYVPDHTLRKLVEKNIEKHVPTMSSQDIETVETWNLVQSYEENKDRLNDIDRGIELAIFEVEKKTLKDKLREIENVNSQLRLKLTEKGKDAQKKIAVLEGSIRYRIGDLLVQSLSSPIEAIKLPGRLFMLFKERKGK